MKDSIVVLALLIIFGGPGAVADDEVGVTLDKMTDHVYRITARSGFEVNFVASVGPDGILLVDTGFKETAAELKAALQVLGMGDVKYVINTHAHVDHTGGNRVFGDAAVVISHSALRDKIGRGRYIVEENPPSALPDVTFDRSLSLYFNGEEVRITAIPGSHDNDDLVVHFTGSKVVYMGDLAYGLNYPSYDTRTGDATRYAAVVSEALAILPDDVTVVSGHGKNCTIPEMREYQTMLEETTAIVLAEVERGKGHGQIDAKVLGKWGGYAGEYQDADDWIRSLVDSATQRGKTKAEVIEPMYLARKENDIDAAISTFHEIYERTPGQYYGALYIFGHYLIDQKSWSEAVKIFDLANTVYPDSHYVWVFWSSQAEAHLGAGETDEAIRKYRRSLELNPDNAEAKARLAELMAE